jgi:hypothetical protein
MRSHIYLLFSDSDQISHVFHDVNEALLEGIRLHLSVRRLSIGEGGKVKNSMVIYSAKDAKDAKHPVALHANPIHSYQHEAPC